VVYFKIFARRGWRVPGLVIGGGYSSLRNTQIQQRRYPRRMEKWIGGIEEDIWEILASNMVGFPPIW